MAAQRNQQAAQATQTTQTTQARPSALRRFQAWITDHLSIRQRLALSIALLVTATLLLFSVIVYTVEQNQLQSNATSDVRVSAVSIASALRQGQSVTQGTGGSNVLPTSTPTGRPQSTTTGGATTTAPATTPAPNGSVTPGATAGATPNATSVGSPVATGTSGTGGIGIGATPSPTPVSTPDPTSSRLIQSRLDQSRLNVLGQLDLGFEVLDTSGRLKYRAPSLNNTNLPTDLSVIDDAIHGSPGYYMKRNASNALLEIYAQPIIVASDAEFGQSQTGALTTPTPTTGAHTTATPNVTGDTRGVAIGNGQEVIGVVLVAKPLDDITNTLTTLSRILIIVDLIAIVAVSLISWWIAESGLRPITKVTRAARAIAVNAHAAGLGTRVTYHGARDEVGELVSTFNDMLASIEQVTNAQRRFVADASHELRAPLTTIKGSLEFLRRAPDLPEEDRTAMLEDAYAESERMAALVSDLLLLARVDASASSRGARAALLDEQLTWRREPVEVDQLAMEVFRYGRAQLRARHKDLSLIISNLEPVTVLADPGQLRQLALILLDNAIKYTPTGGKIRISVTRNGSRAAFSVSDTGIGIDPADRPHIFERFYRADRARERDEHGSGLGLAIAKWIAEAHGGEMSVHSQPGQGSTFTALLPAVRRSDEQSDTTKPKAVAADKRRAEKKPEKPLTRRPERQSATATGNATMGGAMNPLTPLARLAKTVSRPRSNSAPVGATVSAPANATANTTTMPSAEPTPDATAPAMGAGASSVSTPSTPSTPSKDGATASAGGASRSRRLMPARRRQSPAGAANKANNPPESDPQP